MKFGKQLQLGTYAPWKEYYIQYGRLKRIIKRRKFIMDQNAKGSKVEIKDNVPKSVSIEMTKTSSSYSSSSAVGETTPLTGGEPPPPPPPVTDKDTNGEGIDFFPVIISEMDKVTKFFVGKLAELRISLEDITSERRNKYRSHHTASDSSQFKKLRDIYVDLAALRSYCELNKTGFAKIIKKYDKCMGESTLETWQSTIDAQVFASTNEPTQLINIVTSLVSRDKLLEWERFATEQQKVVADDMFPAIRFAGLAFSITLFLVAWYTPIINTGDPAASHCLALLLLVVSLWITEALPYFATGLCIPVLVTVLGVLKDPNDPLKLMTTETAAQLVMDSIFNHTTMLLLGGYTISSAFSRSQLELRFAAFLQMKFGKRPKIFIAAIMFVGLFLSMWISNHTAPILCATIVLPIVRDLPSDSRFSKAVLLGLAFACNMGGMMTPISSVQNVLAVAQLEQHGYTVSFGRWLLISIPFCTLATIIAWVIIVEVIKPDDVKFIPVIVHEPQPLGKRNIMVITMSFITIILFAFSSMLKPYCGDIGIIALSFVAFIFGSGVLTEVDFNSFSWHTLFLVGGGNVLGKAITSSGLLGYIAECITQMLPLSKPWLSAMTIVCFCGIVATFVSHTVAALILMPIIASIGLTLNLPEALVIGSAFAVSGAMALPFSSFPNVNSLLIVDDFQRPYLNVNDFLKTGVLTSVIVVGLIATFGFLLIELVVN